MCACVHVCMCAHVRMCACELRDLHEGPNFRRSKPFLFAKLALDHMERFRLRVVLGGGGGKTLHGRIPCMMLHHSLVVLPLRHYLCVLVFRGSRSGKEGMSWVRDRVWVGLGSWRLGEDAQVWRGERGGEWAGEGDQCWIDTHDAKHDGDDAGEGERCYSRRSGGKRLARVAVLLKCIGGLLARVLDEYPNGISTQLIRNLVWIVVVNAHRVDTVRCWSPYPRARVRGALCARAHSVAHRGAVAGARRQRTRPSTRLQGARNGRPPVPRDIASSLVLPVHTVAHALALARPEAAAGMPTLRPSLLPQNGARSPCTDPQKSCESTHRPESCPLRTPGCRTGLQTGASHRAVTPRMPAPGRTTSCRGAEKARARKRGQPPTCPPEVVGAPQRREARPRPERASEHLDLRPGPSSCGRELPTFGQQQVIFPAHGGGKHGQGAKMQENTGRSIFIGNIPYTATEDQLQVRSPARPSRAGGGPRERQLQH